jgi:hypothetical protein
MKKLILLAFLCGCTTQQAQNVVNAVFTVDQALCLVANTGLAGDTNAVQEFEQTCSIAPQLENSIQQFIAGLQVQQAAAKKKP